MRRTSYQQGSLKLAERKKGRVWEFRWREVQIDGSIRRKNIVIGTLEEFPNESAAQTAVDALRLEINQQTPQQLIKSIALDTLVSHYRQHELPDIFNKTKPGPDAADEDRKSYATQVTYEGYLKKWILPRWCACRLADVKAVEVERWLKTLCFKKTGIPLARGSKAKIRNIMSALYSHAIRWEWADKNPITSVRQSAKRQKVPDILTPEEIVAILSELPDPLRTMIELDAFTGLRRGELIGLRWEDVDFEELVLHVRRSVVAMVEGAPKTEASQKDVPLDAQTAESLFTWRQTCPYPAPEHWVFASPAMKGKQPYWPRDSMEVLREACSEKSWHYQARDVSHFPTHVWDSPQCEWREPQGCAGTATACKPEGHDRRLHAGGESTEARSTEQTGEDGLEKGRFKITGPNWTMKKTGGVAEVLYFVGVPDGI